VESTCGQFFPGNVFQASHNSASMANIAYFEVPADDLKQAQKFYHDLLGWEFIPTDVP
jgi:hypothetical protein